MNYQDYADMIAQLQQAHDQATAANNPTIAHAIQEAQAQAQQEHPHHHARHAAERPAPDRPVSMDGSTTEPNK